MKNIKRSVISLLLVLILVVSSFVPVYAASGTSTKLYNYGTRDVVCTTLDGTTAADYYGDSYSYDRLSNLSAESLKTQLHNLMANTHDYTSSYDNCRDLADRTDCENGSGNVLLFYTSYPATMSQYNGWNREHVWPQSLGGGNTSGGGADLHHVRPSDAGVNSSRGNKPYGKSGSNSSEKYGSNPAVGYLGGTYNSTYFEPLDNVKGDVARICLYVWVRWGSAWGADSVTEVFQSVDLLLEWCELDPVDTWEMGRNDVVEDIQGNRNVFIDYPEYAWLIFGREVPDDMVTPSGEASGNTSGGSPSCSHTSQTTSTVAATCTENGKVTVTCVACGKTISTVTLTATGHNYSNGVCVACGLIESNEFTYVFSEYTQGTQYAKNEVHVLDDNITVVTNDCHFTTQLRIYSSSTNNGYAIIKSTSNKLITSLSVNAGNKADTLVVYGSNDDGAKWTEIGNGISVTSTTYKDYTLDFGGEGYKWIKIDVKGSNQVRLASMSLTTKDSDSTPCTHNNRAESTIPATCTDAGTLTITCADCFIVLSTSSIPALGHSMLNGECQRCDYSEAAPPVAQDTWTLVTDASSLKAGDQIVIVAKDYNYALSTTQNNNNRGQVAIVKNGDTITEVTGMQIITLEEGTVSGTFAFNVGNGYLYAASSSGNQLKTQTTNNQNGSWKITISNGTASITAPNSSNRNVLQYNQSSSLFSCYASATQKAVVIYRYASGSNVEPEICTHSPNGQGIITAPTCSDEGYTVYTCAKCGEEDVADVVAVFSHSFVTYSSYEAASCTKNAKEIANCKYGCGTTDIREVSDSMLEHSYIDGTCEYCGASNKTLAGKYYIAAIRSSGNYWYMTSNLGTSSTKRYQAVDSGLTTLPSSITSAEDIYVFVLVKNNDETYSIYAEGVDGDNWLGWSSGNSGIFVSEQKKLNFTVTAKDNGIFNFTFANNTETRYLSLNSTSGNNYFAFYTGTQRNDLSLIPVETEAEKEDAKFTGASLNIGSDLSIRYHVLLADGDVIDGYSVNFTMNNKVATVTEYIYDSKSGKYIFTFCGIAPQCMGDTIYAELVKDGNEIDVIESYSVKQYVVDALALYPENDANRALRQLLVDLLYYGAAAQNYREYKLDTIVTDGIDLSGSTVIPEETNRTVVGESAEAKFRSVGVRFDYINQIFVKIYTEDIDNVKLMIGDTELELTSVGDNIYVAYSHGISALEFGVSIEFDLYYNNALVQTLTYSVDDYAFSKYNDSKIGDLTLALYRYGKSAEAYDATL